MKIAFGHMGYTTDEFWKFSLREWQAAVEGYRTKIGGPDANHQPLDSEELKALMEKYPDGPRDSA